MWRIAPSQEQNFSDRMLAERSLSMDIDGFGFTMVYPSIQNTLDRIAHNEDMRLYSISGSIIAFVSHYLTLLFGGGSHH